MKNKLILFDWGNIVESHTEGYTYRDAWEELFERCGYKGESRYNELGKYQFCLIPDEDEFKKTFEQMKAEYGFNISYDEFVKLYYDTFDKIDYYKDVADYEVSLKDRCYIGIFSDLAVYDKVRLDKQVNLSNYNYVFLSFEMKMRKPDIKLYTRIQEKLPFNPNEILFIDDRSDNIETAKQIGWNVFQATGKELDKIKEACEKFLNN